jgi:hypothetical protein
MLFDISVTREATYAPRMGRYEPWNKEGKRYEHPELSQIGHTFGHIITHKVPRIGQIATQAVICWPEAVTG